MRRVRELLKHLGGRDVAILTFVAIGPSVLHASGACPSAGPLVPPLLGLLGVLCVAPVLAHGPRSLLRPLPLVLLAIYGAYGSRLLYTDCRGQRDATSLSTLGVSESLLQDEMLVATGLFVIALYVVALLVGYRLLWRRDASRAAPPTGHATGTWPKRIVAAVAGGLLVAGLITWLWLLGHLGATPVTSFSESHRLRLVIATTPGLYFVRNFAIWCCWMAFWLPFASRVADARPFRRGEALAFAGLFVLLTFWTLQFGQRFYVLAPAIGVLAVLGLSRGGLRLRYLAAFLILAPVFSGIFTFYRNLSYFERATAAALVASIAAAGVTGVLETGFAGLSGNLETFLLVLRDFGRTTGELQWGATYLGLLFVMLPRSLVSVKPDYPDSWLTHLFHAPSGDPTTGLAFGVLAEHYVNFGIAGILLGGVVAGVLLKALDVFLMTRARSPATLAWYGQIAYVLPVTLAIGGWYTVTTSEILFVTILTAGLALALREWTLRRQDPLRQDSPSQAR